MSKERKSDFIIAPSSFHILETAINYFYTFFYAFENTRKYYFTDIYDSKTPPFCLTICLQCMWSCLIPSNGGRLSTRVDRQFIDHLLYCQASGCLQFFAFVNISTCVCVFVHTCKHVCERFLETEFLCQRIERPTAYPILDLLACFIFHHRIYYKLHVDLFVYCLLFPPKYKHHRSRYRICLIYCYIPNTRLGYLSPILY